jgi:tRNA C32,U32 (ribose-2'-O)-methylase TrmJ
MTNATEKQTPAAKRAEARKKSAAEAKTAQEQLKRAQEHQKELMAEYGGISVQEENMKDALNQITNRKNQLRAEMKKFDKMIKDFSEAIEKRSKK